MPRVLVAGIGNIFLGDDGFGVEVVRRLGAGPVADGVDVTDFGIRGVHLAYELADGKYDGAILVDAIARGGAPGTLYAIEPSTDGSTSLASPDAHSLDPASVLAWLNRVSSFCPRIIVVGCEPERIEESMGLSRAVSASIDGALEMVRRFTDEMMRDEGARPCA